MAAIGVMPIPAETSTRGRRTHRVSDHRMATRDIQNGAGFGVVAQPVRHLAVWSPADATDTLDGHPERVAAGPDEIVY